MTVRPDTNALTPLLQFNDVAFGISRIDDAKETDTIYFCCGNLSDGTATGRNYGLQRLVHIVNRKCNVSEPALIRGWRTAINEFVIAENLERGAILAIARQTQVDAGKMRASKRGHTIEPRAGHIAFRTFGLTSEYLGVEANQIFPITRNQICVNVLGSDWHCFLLL
jgi:hypothetical protein